MATIKGLRFSDSDTSNIAIDMSDTLAMISPFEVPLLNVIGKDSLSTPCVAVKHEWLEGALRPLDTAVADSGDLANTTDPVTFNVTAGHGMYIRAGDILKVESELMRVTAVSTDDITVARGFGGSTTASHAATPDVAIIGNVNLQNAALGQSRTTTKSGLYNYVQLMEDSVQVTTTEAAIKKYVEENTLTAQLRDVTRTAWLMWERTLLHGRKVASTSTVAGAMDGILVRISTNAYAKSSAYLTEAHLRTALKDIWVAGGVPTHLFCNWFQKERIDALLDSQRQTTRTDTTAGSVIRRYESEYGDVDIVLNRNMPSDTVLIIDKSKIGFGPLRNHAFRAEPVMVATNTYDAYQLLAQYTSETRNETAHAKITGLATS
jgi:hypothetical protein